MEIFDMLKKELLNRILVLDGAMGTSIQRLGLSGLDYCLGDRGITGESLMGNNELLTLSRRDVIEVIHNEYLKAGSDIITTNTFNANSISQADYGTESLCYELNFEGARLARRCADMFAAGGKPRFVAGSVGPTNKSASFASDSGDGSKRAVTFDQLFSAYKEQIEGLVDGGCHIILIETVFDAINAKAALVAANCVFREKGTRLPVMVSTTVADKSGRTLSGQTLEAFAYTIRHENIISMGLNCSFGPKELMPYVKELASISDKFISVHPNAGLPDELGRYSLTPDNMAAYIKELALSGAINIAGGCCGTTSEHIEVITNALSDIKPRSLPTFEKRTVYCGLEPFYLSKENNFFNIGERTNVAGSKRFARLIQEKNYDEAIKVAYEQVENGALAIDVNFDYALIDAPKEMTTFLSMIALVPEIARVPVMIDSSDWETVLSGMKAIQGKQIINSISLKDGEELFIKKAETVKEFCCAVVVMAFDEQGQGDSYERKTAILKRAYDILVNKVNFPPEDIIFDPNVLTIGTGLKEHDNYAVDFINTVKYIKENLPYAKVSGGVSNLSFAFRGNNTVREVIHSIFLYHAISAGLDMGILNTTGLPSYDHIEPELKRLAEDLILNKESKSIDALTNYAGKDGYENEAHKKVVEWRQYSPGDRLCYAVVKGDDSYVEADITDSLKVFSSPVEIIEKPLMDGMNKVGQLFADGKMFLPQVLRSAGVMKKAVSILTPKINEHLKSSKKDRKSGKILLATVKGDVHDIGKNIAGIVLSCNGYEIIDIGVMAKPDDIIKAAKDETADIIGVSGLITPSLKEMGILAEKLEHEGMDVPLIVGGATTSELHTAVKLWPLYNGGVVHVSDASVSVAVAGNLIHNKTEYLTQLKTRYEQISKDYEETGGQRVSIRYAREHRFICDFETDITIPQNVGTTVYNHYNIKELRKHINWKQFFAAWELTGNEAGRTDELERLRNDAEKMLDSFERDGSVSANAVIGFFPANAVDDSVFVYKEKGKPVVFNMDRQTVKNNEDVYISLADFIAPKDSGYEDYLGGFAVSVFDKVTAEAPYEQILRATLCDRLAEAFSELLGNNAGGIRPAFGYSCLKEHAAKQELFGLLEAEKNIGAGLTETFMMKPKSSTCGLYFTNKKARYFNIK